MRITKGAAIVVFAGAFAVLAGTLGPLVAAYASALAGLGLVVGIMGYSAFIAVRNWRLDNLPRRHPAPPQAVEPREAPRAVEPSEETRRAA